MSSEEEKHHEYLVTRAKIERDAKKVVELRLEEKYAERGLKFTFGFRGSIPTQAFGTIDGYLFYFRYRGDYAQLRVGFIEEDRYEQEYARDMKFHNDRIARFGLGGDKWHDIPPEKQVLNGETDMPTSLRKVASIADVLDDPYNGTLTADECEMIFIRLVESLEDIEHEVPVTIEDLES